MGRMTKAEKKRLLENAIKEEIIITQKMMQDVQKTIKGLKDNDTLFPLWSCKLHNLEFYKETLENLKV